MRKITWSDEAESDYDENIDFLLRKWGFAVAEEFVTKVDDMVFNLKNKTVVYQPSKFKGLKKCVVCKRIILYYRIKSEQEIELVRFWNTHMDDKKLKF